MKMERKTSGGSPENNDKYKVCLKTKIVEKY